MVLEYFCPICQAEFLDLDDIFRTKCGHVFHKICLHDWLATYKSCADCDTLCSEAETFKIFIQSRDSVFVKELLKLMDENGATLLELQSKLNEQNSPQINEDLKAVSNLQNQENDQTYKRKYIREIAERDDLINHLKTELREKTLELAKEKRNSALITVERMKLQQQLVEARKSGVQNFKPTSPSDIKTTDSELENLNQLNKSKLYTAEECRTLTNGGGAVNKKSGGNSRHIDNATFGLFKYAKRLHRYGYRSIFYNDNVVYIRKNHFSENIKIENRAQVDELMMTDKDGLIEFIMAFSNK